MKASRNEARFCPEASSPEKIGFMMFVDSLQYHMHERRTANLVFSLIFFAYMLMNSSAQLVLQEEKGPVRNIISGVLSCTAWEPKQQSEFRITELLYTVISVLIMVFVTITIIPIRRYTHLMNQFIVLVYGLVPILLVMFINIFMRSYRLIDAGDSSGLITSFNTVMHIIILVFIALMSVIGGCGAYMPLHAFISTDLTKTVILMIYFTVSVHISGPFNNQDKYMVMLQLILSLAMTVWDVIVPLYIDRVMNVFLLWFSMNSFFIQIIVLTGIQWRYTAYIILIVTMAASICWFYFGYNWLSYSRSMLSVRRLIVSGKTKAARLLMKHINISSIPVEDLREAVQYAFRLNLDLNPGQKNLNRTERLLDRFKSVGLISVDDVLFVWSAGHYLAEKRGTFPVALEDSIRNRIGILSERRKDFWRLVWLSHGQSLSRLGSSIGRDRYQLMEYFAELRKRFSLYFEKNWEHPVWNSDFEMTETKSRFRPVVLLYVIVYIVSTAIIITVYCGHLKKSDELESDKWIIYFTSNLSRLTIEVASFGDYTGYRKIVEDIFTKFVDESSTNPVFKSFVNFDPEGSGTFTSHYRKFLECIEDKKRADVGQCFMQSKFIDTIMEARRDRSNYYVPTDLSNSKEFIIAVIVITSFLVVAIVGLAIIAYVRSSKKIKTLYKEFLRIPKSILTKFGKFETRVDVMTSLPIRREFKCFEILQAKALLYLVAIIGMAVGIGMYILFFLITRSQINEMNATSDKLGIIQNVQLFTAAITASAASVLNSVAVRYFGDLGNMILQYRTSSYANEYTRIVPPSLYQMITTIVVDDQVSFSYRNATDICEQMAQELLSAWTDMEPFTRVMTITFVAVLLLTVVFFILWGLVLRTINPVSEMELEVGNELLEYGREQRRQSEDFEMEVEELRIKKGKVVLAEIPALLVVLNKSKSVEYATWMAKSEYKIETGETLDSTSMSADLRREIYEYIELTDAKGSYIDPIKIYDQKRREMIHVSPCYKFYNNRVNLEWAVLFWSPENSPGNKRYEMLLSKVLPEVVTKDYEPVARTYDSTGSYTYMLIVKLAGFHAWAASVDPQTGMKFRRDVSDEIRDFCKEDNVMIVVEENPDSILLTEDPDNRINRCKVIETCFKLGSSIQARMNEAKTKFSADITPRVMIFKCFDDEWYLPDPSNPLSYLAPMSGLTATALEYERVGKTGSINFAIQVGAPKSQNETIITKVGEHRTNEGEAFDLFLVV